MNQNYKNYRIKTEVNNKSSYNLNINLEQQYDILEILSLNINMTNTYKLFASDYGVLVGRVYANGGFGVPNAKVSAFIQKNSKFDDAIINTIYPYFNSKSKNSDDIRYNLLPNEDINTCHNSVGTFPTKRLTLDDSRYIEVFDEYYKYTTVTNSSGDYMLFGLPTGNQVIHMDVDLSDIGPLSQKPRDFIYKGYNINQFENPNQFKTDKNLDNLVQIITQNTPTNIYPFWGDVNENEVGITRLDMELQYKFEPTCVFMGSIITDKEDVGITKNCRPKSEIGVMSKLSTGEGTIEMIRKLPNNTVEEIQVKGNQLIDSNGVWCYQIPMNLDYMITDEYGNMVPTDNTTTGIPTRTKARFRVSKSNSGGEFKSVFRGKILIPNNPKTKQDVDYEFGSSTSNKSYCDLFWNNVYTVKSFIPRFQKYNKDKDKKFTGIKNISNYGSNSPIPYNNFRIYNRFMFTLMCNIIKFIISLTKTYNKYIVSAIPEKILGYRIWTKRCLSLPEGYCDGMEGWSYAPGCKNSKGFNNLFKDLVKGEAYITDPKSIESKNSEEQNSVCLTTNTDYLIQCVEIQLAQEYGLINFDFYNDWINGTIYIPQFHRQVKSKKSYFFNLIKRNGGVKGCFDITSRDKMRLTQQCALTYKQNDGIVKTSATITSPLGCKNDRNHQCHKGAGRKGITIFGENGGLMHIYKNLKGQQIYYYKPIEFTQNKIVPLFLTDIVLLGSIDENNIYGIPKINDEIPSTTYQLPDDLAITNADEIGYTFGLDKNGTRCSGTVNVDSKPTLVSNSNLISDTSSYAVALKKANPDSDNLEDYSETNLFTIMSGIDWGYTGPKQLSNNMSDLYYPGGNFLGIACGYAESNIKSCVNLTRACEIGVMLDQIQEIEKSKDETLIVNPDGLISKDEILDGDYRAIFATLNSGNLSTTYDNNTGYLKYDFTYSSPLNFDGALINKINKNVKMYDKLNPNRIKLEYQDSDYYRFRMGANPRYLINLSNGDVALPVYNNSYYFYFGLKDGNSAIDKFYHDFYSVCKKTKTESFSISTSAYSATLCGGGSDGIIDFQSDDAYLPISYYLYDANGGDPLITGTTLVETDDIMNDDIKYTVLTNHASISGLTNQEYILELVDSKLRSVTKIIDLKTPELTAQYDPHNLLIQKSYIMGDISFDNEDFREKIFLDIQTDVTSYGGYLSVSNILIDGKTVPMDLSGSAEENLFILLVRYGSNGSVSEYVSNSASTIYNSNLPNLVGATRITNSAFIIKDETMIIPIWETNVNYELFIAQKCNSEIKGTFYNYKFTITEPKQLELVINDIYASDIIDFKTGIFSGDTIVNGYNRLSHEISYDWTTISKNYSKRYDINIDFGLKNVPNAAVGNMSVVANRDAFIRKIKKALWFDDYEENIINFKGENGTQPYINTIIFNQEISNDSGIVLIGDNILLTNSTIQNQQKPTIKIGDSGISALTNEKLLISNGLGDTYDSRSFYIYGVDDDSAKTYNSIVVSANTNITSGSPMGVNVKLPYFGFITDYSGKKTPNASGDTIPITDVNLKSWFGMHMIYKPFYIDFTFVNSFEGYYRYNTDNTSGVTFTPVINGNIHNGATQRKYLSRNDTTNETVYYFKINSHENNGRSYLGDCFLVNLDKNNMDIYQNTLYKKNINLPYYVLSYINTNKYSTANTASSWDEYDNYEDLFYKRASYINIDNVLATRLYGDYLTESDTTTIASKAINIIEFDNEIPGSIIDGWGYRTKQNTIYDDYSDSTHTAIPIKPISGRTFDWTTSVQNETEKITNLSGSRNFSLHISEPNVPSNTVFGDSIDPSILEYNFFIQNSSEKTIEYNMTNSTATTLSIRINDYIKTLNNEYYLIPSSGVSSMAYNNGTSSGDIFYPYYSYTGSTPSNENNLLFNQFLKNEDLVNNISVKHIKDGYINLKSTELTTTSYFILNMNEIVTHINPINNKTRTVSARAFTNALDLNTITNTQSGISYLEEFSGYTLELSLFTENWYFKDTSSILDKFKIDLSLCNSGGTPVVGYEDALKCVKISEFSPNSNIYIAYFLIKPEDKDTLIGMINTNKSKIEIFDTINNMKYINNLE